ncbi:ArsR/SmtB family transcription factor [Haloarchaeobius salinus]|uniref:ArsR/SmtB family transcription factor n=1 Tax=Haloarchaeobius salinus TaxID=1198298 RepID=UPI00210D2B47|nr:metalloregulator ArsR/SmtB family transcription factor [Haloarchaeobius salinus]
MATTERLERLITDERGSCCDGDVDARIRELDAVRERATLDRTPTDTAVFDALSTETRLDIVRLLDAAEDELCVCELEPLVDVSDSAVSHALSTLTDAGLVARRKEGRWRYYRTTDRAEALLAAVVPGSDDTTTGAGGGSE